jgi:hypothetical protein
MHHVARSPIGLFPCLPAWQARHLARFRGQGFLRYPDSMHVSQACHANQSGGLAMKRVQG